MTRSRAFDVVLVTLLWAGGLFGTERVVGRLLDTGTDTGFSAEEDVEGVLPVQRLTLENSGHRRARVRIMLPRSMPADGGYGARIESDTTRLQVVRERVGREGTWFEVRNAAAGMDGMFRWPAQRALLVAPPAGTHAKFEVLDWQVVLDAGPPDSRFLDRRRARVDAVLLALFVLGSLAGVINLLRQARGAHAVPPSPAPNAGEPQVGTTPPPPPDPAPHVAAAAEAHVIPADEIKPALFLDLLVTSVHGPPDEEAAMQRFLRLRLGGYDYNSAMNSLALDPGIPRYRRLPHRAAAIFSRKVDACIEEFTRARQRFP